MPDGKKAGEHCVNLDSETLLCRIWGTDQYPLFCRRFLPEEAFCGTSREEAERILTFLEEDTRPRQHT